MMPTWMVIAQAVSGTALYLYGVEKSLFALKVLHGETRKRRLGVLADDNLQGWRAGLVAGALLLSNRVVLELLGELASIHLLAWTQTLPMLLGSLIGAMPLAMLVGLAPSGGAVVPLVAGLILLYTTTQTRLRAMGHLLLGCGVLWFGLATLEGVLRATPWLVEFFVTTSWLMLPVTFLAAALLGSANALIGLMLPLAGLGLFSLSTGLVLVLAANVGGAFPLALLARESSAPLKRLILVGLLFQGVGLVGSAGWLPEIAAGLDWLPGGDPVRLLGFHVLFNVWIGLAGQLLIRPLAALADRLLPDPYGTETPGENVIHRYWPRYLDDEFLETPTLALAMARREVGLIVALIEEMLALVPEALFSGDPQVITRLRKMDDRVDEIHHAITRYLAGISGANLAAQCADELLASMTVTHELESIGDIIENNLAHLAESRLGESRELSPETRQALDRYHQAVVAAFRQAADAFLTDDPHLAREVMAQKESISVMDAQGRLAQMRAIQGGVGDFAAYTLQMDLYENLKRIFYHAKRIAKVVARA
ncbi:MAG: Na/Pi cotransporter family protein [Magnetococcales bacterium]|nr:Na/Pi cotransporter family protein [Magnetococcales bacterium]